MFLDSQYLVILAVTMVMVAFQYFFFEHTLLGKKLQATSQDKDMARLLGIPGGADDRHHLHLQLRARRTGRRAGRPGAVRVDRHGLDHRA